MTYLFILKITDCFKYILKEKHFFYCFILHQLKIIVNYKIELFLQGENGAHCRIIDLYKKIKGFILY